MSIRSILKFLLAWFPLAVLWALFLVSYGNGTIRPTVAIQSAVQSIGSAAVLSLVIWWFSGVVAWPERVRFGFYAAHLAMALVYSASWQISVSAFEAVQSGRSVFVVLGDQWGLVGWRVLTGVCLYGLVAGTCYALRIREKLREQEAVAARAETLVTKARLEALRAQLNPHFLFNALHSVAALVRRDPDAAERAVDRLGGLLRYALDGCEHEDVSLDEEWAFTRDYLEIEKLRFEDRLRLSVAIAPEAKALRVPPFSLQPLIENALRHGIAPRPEGGQIRISAVVEGSDLIIRVSDDGVGGVDDADLARGFGLGGLRQRLASLYGSRGDLRVQTSASGGFAVTLMLPAWSP